MVTGDLRRVIVIDPGGRPVGLITDGDLVARVAPNSDRVWWRLCWGADR